MTRGGYALGLLAESHLGRPTKLEGNPLHPASLGATDAAAQASILSLYDPDRSQTIRYRGSIETWDRFITEITAKMHTLRERGGAGLRILTETVTSPTLAGQIQSLLAELTEARWHQYEPAGLDNVREGARLAFGRYVDAVYYFDRADVVLSLDADFLVNLPGSVRYAREFAGARRVAESSGSMNRLFVVESTPTITGAAADHRLPLRPTLVEQFAREVAARLNVPGATAGSSIPGVPDEWLNAVVQDLAASRGASLVIADPGQPPIVHALAHAINDALGNSGQTVVYLEPVEARPENQLTSLQALLADMRAGRVDTLVILGGNPAYSTPGPLAFAEQLSQVSLRVHLSEYYDETSFRCDWHVPAAHFLESWSDARAYDGTASIIQPLIEPLYGGKTPHELLAVLQGQPGRSAFDILHAHWKQALGEENFAMGWRRALHDGLIADSRSPIVEVALQAIDFGPLPNSPQQLDVEFRPDPSLGDGRDANNGWLHELPKPLTKITWDNVAAISAATARRLGVASEDILEIRLGDLALRAPAWIMPGQPDDCVSLTLGYGRTHSGRVGTGVGYSAYVLRLPEPAWFATGATVHRTGARHRICTTQNHHSMEGRDIVRVTTNDRVRSDAAHPLDAADLDHDLPTLYPEYPSEGNAWGMVIDQTACIGCNACVVACQAENNIPIVGKEQVGVGREMHWLRIDRYYHGELASPETYFQPMLCQHCENAPCEVVCPVAATVHDSEGTNNMIYNRCVGTRYCSNNCPYKVRRFNYLQYADETTPSLKLLNNPDVTVRSRGVMEKCTYCIQRISAARIDAKKENRPIRDGEVLTACQQACPTQAIVFGNLNDPQAAVTKLKVSPLNYGVLAELNTQPRTTYLPRVVNPHPDLPAPAAADAARASHP
jgi:molybdopterin-containing oxidoreductase family iron-sulfur binding subunit